MKTKLDYPELMRIEKKRTDAMQGISKEVKEHAKIKMIAQTIFDYFTFKTTSKSYKSENPLSAAAYVVDFFKDAEKASLYPDEYKAQNKSTNFTMVMTKDKIIVQFIDFAPWLEQSDFDTSHFEEWEIAENWAGRYEFNINLFKVFLSKMVYELVTYSDKESTKFIDLVYKQLLIEYGY